MSPLSRRRWIVYATVAVIGVGIVAGLVWLRMGGSPPKPTLLFNFIGPDDSSDSNGGSAMRGRKVVPDDLRRKYDPTKRGDFYLTSTQDTSIFVLATGVQVSTPSGWKTVAEEYRGEIWRFKPGTPHELCVERPAYTNWRAYIRFGSELKGPSLLKVQLREAWKIRSFSNWTGKAWGGGRFGGTNELFSAEVIE